MQEIDNKIDQILTEIHPDIILVLESLAEHGAKEPRDIDAAYDKIHTLIKDKIIEKNYRNHISIQ